MPDSPDYEKYRPGSVRFSLQDMGELAVRMGSYNIYDRRGETIFTDDFSHGISGWLSQPFGAGSSGSLSADKIYNSPYKYRAVLSSVSPYTSLLTRYLTTMQLVRVGFETMFSCVSPIDNIIFTIAVWDGVNFHDTKIELSETNHKAYYYDGAGFSHEIMTIPSFIGGESIYTPIKFVIDLSSLSYVRFFLGKFSVDMTNATYTTTPDTTAPKMYCQLSMTGKSSSNGIVSLAYIIISGNEP